MKEIAKVINNNQIGWTNIIETAPNVTLDVGTKLYINDYAYKDIKEYEDIIGSEVNDAFKIGWDMARATMEQLNKL